MKVAVISDLHFGARNDSTFFARNQMKFWDEIFFPYIDENKIGTVFIGGDVWENRKTLNVLTLNNCLGFFKKFKDRGINVYVIYGNHDVYYRSTNEVNSLDFLGEIYDNIEIIKEPETLFFDGKPIAFVPWVNKNNLDQFYSFIEKTEAEILLGHFEINGATMLPGVECTSGLKASVFDKFKLVMSGHFHTVSEMGNIFYVSNPSQTSWADYSETKGGWVLDLETLEKTRILNPFNVYEKLDFTNDIDILKFDYVKYSEKVVRVYITNYFDINKNKLLLFLEKLGEFSVGIDVFETNQITTVRQVTNDEVKVATDMRILIREYVKEFDGLDTERLTNKFLGVYEESERLS